MSFVLWSNEERRRREWNDEEEEGDDALLLDDASQWSYVGEGHWSLVVGRGTRALRLRKCYDDDDEKTAPLDGVADDVRQFMRRWLPPAYEWAARHVRVGGAFLRALAASITVRRGRIDERTTHATLMPQLAASMRVCIELKPKWGADEAVQDAACAYCAHQRLKVARGALANARADGATYCPLDLFADDDARRRRALAALAAAPQNNARGALADAIDEVMHVLRRSRVLEALREAQNAAHADELLRRVARDASLMIGYDGDDDWRVGVVDLDAKPEARRALYARQRAELARYARDALRECARGRPRLVAIEWLPEATAVRGALRHVRWREVSPSVYELNGALRIREARPRVGGVVWGASLALLDELLARDVRGRTLLELGAGCGHLSLALAARFERVVCTDADTRDAAANARANAAAARNVSLATLRFGDDVPCAADVVLVAEVLYSAALHDALRRTLRAACRRAPHALYVVYERRNVGEDAFMRSLDGTLYSMELLRDEDDIVIYVGSSVKTT